MPGKKGLQICFNTLLSILDAIRVFKEDWHDRKKRSVDDEEGVPHPTVVSHEDKWIAGVC